MGLAVVLVGCRAPETPGPPGTPLPDPPVGAYLQMLEMAADSAGLEGAVDELRHLLGWSDDAAASRLPASATGRGPMSDWAVLLRARIAAAVGDTTALRGLLDDLPPDLRRTSGAALVPGAYRAAGDLPGAVRAALGALSTADGEAVDELLWQASEAQLARGDTVTASRLARRLLEKWPLGRAAGRVLRRPLPIRPTAPDVVARVRAHLARGELDAAAAALDLLPPSSRHGSGEALDLRASLAESLLDGRRWNEAEAQALRVLEPDAGPDLASRAQRVVGEARLAAGRPSAGRLALKRAASGDGEASRRAALRLGELAEADPAEARHWLAPLAAGERGESAEARWLLGLLEYRQGAFLRAALLFDGAADLWEGLPAAPRALFWAGLAYRQEGSAEISSHRLGAASRSDLLGFYGVRARRALGSADAAGLLQVPEGPAGDPAVHRLARGALHRIDALEMLGLTDDANHEETRARAALALVPGGLHTFAEALHEAGHASRGMAVAADARERLGAWDRRLLRAFYPLPSIDAVRREAGRLGVSPALVAALVRRELACGTVGGPGRHGRAPADPEVSLELAIRDPAAPGLSELTVAAAIFEGLYPDLVRPVSVAPAATRR